MNKFKDMLTNELPKKLSPNRLIDNKIDLILRAEPLKKISYRLNQLELSKLKK